MRFHARSVGKSSAVASSYRQKEKKKRKSTFSNKDKQSASVGEQTHCEGVPYARKWLCDDVEDAHAAMQEREVVVAHVSEAAIVCTARAEKAIADC